MSAASPVGSPPPSRISLDIYGSETQGTKVNGGLQYQNVVLINDKPVMVKVFVSEKQLKALGKDNSQALAMHVQKTAEKIERAWIQASESGEQFNRIEMHGAPKFSFISSEKYSLYLADDEIGVMKLASMPKEPGEDLREIKNSIYKTTSAIDRFMRDLFTSSPTVTAQMSLLEPDDLDRLMTGAHEFKEPAATYFSLPEGSRIPPRPEGNAPPRPRSNSIEGQ